MSNRNRNKKKQPASKPQAEGQNRITHTQQRIEQFSGPIPSPELLERYNQVVPNAAVRILQMAESDASHQQQIEMAALNAQRHERRLGQYFGFAIGIAALSVSALAIINGSTAAASIIGGTTVVGLVAVFVTGRIFGISSK